MSRPCAKRDDPIRATRNPRRRAPLRGPHPLRYVLPRPRHQRQAPLPHARRQGQRCAAWQSQCLEAWLVFRPGQGDRPLSARDPARELRPARRNLRLRGHGRQPAGDNGPGGLRTKKQKFATSTPYTLGFSESFATGRARRSSLKARTREAFLTACRYDPDLAGGSTRGRRSAASLQLG